MQYASSFHYFNAAISLNPFFATSYMYLGLALSNLGDIENACGAYEKALSMEEDFLIYLNYSLSLFNYGREDKATQMFICFQQIFDKLDAVTKDLDQDIHEKRRILAKALGFE